MALSVLCEALTGDMKRIEARSASTYLLCISWDGSVHTFRPGEPIPAFPYRRSSDFDYLTDPAAAKEIKMSQRKKDVGVDLGLTGEEREQLRKMARAVIENRSRGKDVSLPPEATGNLQTKCGAFVTIHKQGMLRGCIGSIESDNPLVKTVADMAEAAAFRDPRFRPVTEEELPYLDLEISVLTPLQKITDPEQIEVGKHGIVIRKGYRSGLLLPQVATERDWDCITFLGETCRKAGLPMNAWKDPDTDIFVFSADVF
jgi:AmmeMemoRadiSam system protein A